MLGSAQTKLPPLTLTSWVKGTSSFLWILWWWIILLSNKNRWGWTRYPTSGRFARLRAAHMKHWIQTQTQNIMFGRLRRAKKEEEKEIQKQTWFTVSVSIYEIGRFLIRIGLKRRLIEFKHLFYHVCLTSTIKFKCVQFAIIQHDIDCFLILNAFLSSKKKISV